MRKKPATLAIKAAAAPVGSVSTNFQNLIASIKQRALDALPTPGGTGHPLATTFGVPAAVGVAGAGLVGGWHGMSSLIDNRRKAGIDDELEQAKNEYYQALAAPHLPKTAADASVLDSLCDHYEKTAASWGEAANNGWEGLKGGLMLAGLGTAAATGYGTYQWVKARDRSKLLQKAIAMRARQRTAPQPIYAVPAEISTNTVV